MKYRSNKLHHRAALVERLALALGSAAFAMTTVASNSALASELRYVHPSPDGAEEVCLVPSYYETRDLKYVNVDSDREDELKLCRLTVYEGMASRAKIERVGNLGLDPLPAKEVVACPKLNSTNPGTNFVDIPKGMSFQQAKQEFCVPKGMIDGEFIEDYDLDAKFKSTISCSSTASALGYYHISRILGGAGRVPVAVLRTLSRESHHQIVEQAESILGTSDEIIAKNWRTFSAASKNAAAGRPNPKLYTEGGRLLYGALQKNLKGEDKYTEVSGVGSYEERYARFLHQPPFQLVADARPVEQIAGADFFEVAQSIVQMQDVSDMVLMDTLMSQDDRIGNIHVKPWVLEKGATQLRKMKKSEESALKAYMKQVTAELKKKNPRARDAQFSRDMARRATSLIFPKGEAAVVAAMHLKDNDCGTDVDIRGNQMRRHNALESVRHMSPDTYRRFLKFAVEVDSGRFKPFAIQSLTYREKDYEGTRYSLRENVRHAAKVLIEACERGDLRLDLALNFDANGNFRPPAAVACR